MVRCGSLSVVVVVCCCLLVAVDCRYVLSVACYCSVLIAVVCFVVFGCDMFVVVVSDFVVHCSSLIDTFVLSLLFDVCCPLIVLCGSFGVGLFVYCLLCVVVDRGCCLLYIACGF